jgi:hypothetical protein
MRAPRPSSYRRSTKPRSFVSSHTVSRGHEVRQASITSEYGFGSDPIHSRRSRISGSREFGKVPYAPCPVNSQYDLHSTASDFTLSRRLVPEIAGEIGSQHGLTVLQVLERGRKATARNDERTKTAEWFVTSDRAGSVAATGFAVHRVVCRDPLRECLASEFDWERVTLQALAC